MADAVRFIRKNGKVIPIGAAATGAARAARTVNASSVAHKVLANHASNKGGGIKVNPLMNIAGLGLSVASGAIAAATFSTPKGLVAGHAVAKVIDIAGISANVASVAGKGHIKERAEQGAKQEARNFVAGNAVFAAGVLATKANRKAAVQYAGKIGALAKKFLRLV